MKNLQHVRTRRQLLRVTAVGAASFPFLALSEQVRIGTIVQHKDQHETKTNTSTSNSTKTNTTAAF